MIVWQGGGGGGVLTYTILKTNAMGFRKKCLHV